MTDIPTPAVEAAAVTLCRDLMGGNDGPIPCEGCRSDAEMMVTAAAPHIEAQVRETIADALEAIDSNDWAWRGMDVNTGTFVAQFIRDGYVLPPIGDGDE